MGNKFKKLLSHVLWIGGGTDAGKSTTQNLLASKYRLQVYHYDRRDVLHHDCLATTLPDIRAFLDATDAERWVNPTPKALFERTLQSFQQRFPLVLLDLLNMPTDKPIIAEGFGLTPDLLTPLLSSPNQAIFFASTEAFKWASMKKRNKYFRRLAWEDGEKAIDNLFKRDMMITAEICNQAQKHHLRVHKVDGSFSAEETVDLVAQHFAPHLP